MSRVVVTVDLGFGDSGKGSVVDYLVRDLSAGARVASVVRYSGGPQAAHRVVAPDGREHVFAQFGAGTFVPGSKTLLGRRVLVNPLNLVLEEEHLREIGIGDALDRLSIDSRCVLVTPFHVAANRLREIARGDGRHGSCGQGVGETRSDELAGFSVRAGDVVGSRRILVRKLAEIQERKRAEIAALNWIFEDPRSALRREVRPLDDPALPERLAEAYRRILRPSVVLGDLALADLLREGPVVFEAAQGVLLDERYGFYPYTTWTDTTTGSALEALDEVAAVPAGVETLGIVRAYQTRHGAGPFPTENADLTATLVDDANGTGRWQGPFRVGWLDVSLLRYAIAANGGIDSFALTCLDRAIAYEQYRGPWLVADYYENLPAPQVPASIEESEEIGRRLAAAVPSYSRIRASLRSYVELLESDVGYPISLASFGPSAGEKVSLRTPSFSLAEALG